MQLCTCGTPVTPGLACCAVGRKRVAAQRGNGAAPVTVLRPGRRQPTWPSRLGHKASHGGTRKRGGAIVLGTHRPGRPRPSLYVGTNGTVVVRHDDAGPPVPTGSPADTGYVPARK